MASSLRKRKAIEDGNAEDSSPPGLRSLSRTVSPPPQKRARNNSAAASASDAVYASPFQLTRIQDLPDEYNAETISLSDILGDPLIKECWEFNYLHDLDFLMHHFDEDVRALVKVHVVHGFWKKEDARLANLKVSAYTSLVGLGFVGRALLYLDSIRVCRSPTLSFEPFVVRRRKCLSRDQLDRHVCHQGRSYTQSRRWASSTSRGPTQAADREDRCKLRDTLTSHSTPPICRTSSEHTIPR